MNQGRIMKTSDFLDLAKRRRKLPSDYALAKALDVGQSTVSNWRCRRSALSDDMAIRLADLAGLPAGFVLACIAAERSHTEPARHAWQELAVELAPDGAQVGPDGAVCITLSRGRPLLRLKPDRRVPMIADHALAASPL